MRKVNDFSRRFLADFIAARLRSVRTEKDDLRRADPDQGLGASGRTEGGPANIPNNQIDSSNSLRRFQP